ncbi:MAG: serine/threonine protein kinase [Planctomycetes bacterium]|nr:serine/threonine protein kinase [Planctomycetota bacterium]
MTACPDFGALILHAHGESDDAALATHVRDCGTCSSLVAEVRSGDAVAARVASALAPAARRGGQVPQVPGYTLEREIGRGGMGVVYAATQLASGRRVALKVVRGAGWVGEATLRLFQREIQVLARLSHKGIAALYDAGATPDGEHWFAMELVEGRTLIQDVEARGLARRARLELFAQICDAIQHAHQKGVVHRDLKPSNILVDAAGEPRVLDFGLARITEADVSLASVASEPGSIRGTLAYMSPEQARGDSQAVGSQSDVYSLGVVLYELLTGALPHDVTRTSLHEAARIICEVAPTRPSQRDPSLLGDLETILLTALEKEPERRYASAAALAGDVRRFLSDEVILARPPSSAYQLRKLVARHKLPFALAAAVFVVAVGSAIALAAAYARAGDEAQAAKEARDEARDDKARAEHALIEEERQRRLADERLVEAQKQSARRQATLDFFMEMIGKARSEALGPQATVAEVVEVSAAELEGRTDLDPDLAATIGVNVAGVENSLGRHERAHQRLRWAIARQEATGRPFDGDRAFMHIQLATVLQILGRYDPARNELDLVASYFASGVTSDERLLSLHDGALAKDRRARGDFAGAEDLWRSALARLERSRGPLHTETLSALTELAILVADQGRAEEALPLTEDLVRRQEQARGPSHPNALNARVTLAMLYLDLGRNEEARTMLEDALRELERQLGPRHITVLRTTNNLAGAYSRLKQNEQALELWQALLPRQEEALGENAMLALNTRKNIGTMLYVLRRFDEALELQTDLVDRCRAHLPPGHQLQPLVRTMLGKTLITKQRFAEAEAVLTDSLDVLKTMRGSNPEWTRNAAELLVELHERAGTPEKSAPYRELARTGVH